MIWQIDNVGLAYVIFGISSTCFALFSYLLNDKLFVGEATTSTLIGILAGPQLLNWFDPSSWGDMKTITRELSRIVMVIQLFAMSVELPKRYIRNHGSSLLISLFFGMALGCVVIGYFVFILFENIDFAGAFLVGACITATDPVLSAAIVGKGKFGRTVPSYLKNLITAESGANDGLAFPLVMLASALVTKKSSGSEIFTNWLTVGMVYQVGFGIVLGIFIGYWGRELLKFAFYRNLVTRESFLIFYLFVALICTGSGLIFDVDELIVAFAGGAAFAWDGWYAEESEGTKLPGIVDLALNIGYFTYLGAIIPWADYNNISLALEYWRYILLALAAFFLRRIPIFLLIKSFTRDIRSWKDAFIIGHFGPIGVGAVFCSMIALERITDDETDFPTNDVDFINSPLYIARVLWPIVSFLVLTSVIIHGCSPIMITLFSNWNTNRLWMSKRREDSTIPLLRDDTLETLTEQDE